MSEYGAPFTKTRRDWWKTRASHSREGWVTPRRGIASLSASQLRVALVLSAPKWVSSECSATKLFFVDGVAVATSASASQSTSASSASTLQQAPSQALKRRLLSEQIKLGLRREPCQVLLLDTHSCLPPSLALTLSPLSHTLSTHTRSLSLSVCFFLFFVLGNETKLNSHFVQKERERERAI